MHKIRSGVLAGLVLCTVASAPAFAQVQRMAVLPQTIQLAASGEGARAAISAFCMDRARKTPAAASTFDNVLAGAQTAVVVRNGVEVALEEAIGRRWVSVRGTGSYESLEVVNLTSDPIDVRFRDPVVFGEAEEGVRDIQDAIEALDEGSTQWGVWELSSPRRVIQTVHGEQMATRVDDGLFVTSDAREAYRELADLAFDVRDVEVISLFHDDFRGVAEEIAEAVTGQAKNVETWSALREHLNRVRDRTVLFVGHINNGAFEIEDAGGDIGAGGRIPIGELIEEVEAAGVTPIIYGCKAARLGVTGPTNDVTSKQVARHLSSSTSATTYAQFFERLGTAETDFVLTREVLEGTHNVAVARMVKDDIDQRATITILVSSSLLSSLLEGHGDAANDDE